MKKRLIYGIITALALVIFYVQKGAAVNLFTSWNLIPRSEDVTELYINNHAGIPTAIVAGETVPLSFTIHNLEGVEKTYEYLITAEAVVDATSTQVLGSGSVTVANNASSTIATAYTFASTTTPIIVSISLPQSGHTLHVQIPKRQ